MLYWQKIRGKILKIINDIEKAQAKYLDKIEEKNWEDIIKLKGEQYAHVKNLLLWLKWAANNQYVTDILNAEDTLHELIKRSTVRGKKWPTKEYIQATNDILRVLNTIKKMLALEHYKQEIRVPTTTGTMPVTLNWGLSPEEIKNMKVLTNETINPHYLPILDDIASRHEHTIEQEIEFTQVILLHILRELFTTTNYCKQLMTQYNCNTVTIYIIQGIERRQLYTPQKITEENIKCITNKPEMIILLPIRNIYTQNFEDLKEYFTNGMNLRSKPSNQQTKKETTKSLPTPEPFDISWEEEWISEVQSNIERTKKYERYYQRVRNKTATEMMTLLRNILEYIDEKFLKVKTPIAVHLRTIQKYLSESIQIIQEKMNGANYIGDNYAGDEIATRDYDYVVNTAFALIMRLYTTISETRLTQQIQSTINVTLYKTIHLTTTFGIEGSEGYEHLPTDCYPDIWKKARKNKRTLKEEMMYIHTTITKIIPKTFRSEIIERVWGSPYNKTVQIYITKNDESYFAMIWHRSKQTQYNGKLFRIDTAPTPDDIRIYMPVSTIYDQTTESIVSAIQHELQHIFDPILRKYDKNIITEQTERIISQPETEENEHTTTIDFETTRDEAITTFTQLLENPEFTITQYYDKKNVNTLIQKSKRITIKKDLTYQCPKGYTPEYYPYQLGLTMMIQIFLTLINKYPAIQNNNEIMKLTKKYRQTGIMILNQARNMDYQTFLNYYKKTVKDSIIE